MSADESSERGVLIFECERCGKCCQGEGWLRNIIHPSDVDRWRELGRGDILRYVCSCCSRPVDPDNNNARWAKQSCPFLVFENGKAACRIYDVRPRSCRTFPIRRCENPQCPEEFHVHTWLWNGNCPAAKKFRTNMVRAIESQLQILVEEPCSSL